MKDKYKTKLLVNKKSVELNPFIEEYLARISVGIVTSLKGIDYVRSIEIHHEHDDVSVEVNGEPVSLTPFPVKIIANTLLGLVSALKGIDELKSLHVSVEVS